MKIHIEHRSRRGAGGRRGSALVLSLITVLIVAVLAAGYLQTSSALTKRQGQSIDTKEAFYLAEAGLAEAFSGMMIGKTGKVGSKQAPAKFGHGCFWVEAEEAGNNLIELESTGLYQGGRATLSLVVEEGSESVAALGIFSQQALVVPDGAKLDSYDSSLGSYASQQGSLEVPLEIGSSAGILVAQVLLPTEVDGDVVPGAGASVAIIGQPIITGAQTARIVDPTLPAVIVPGVSLGPGILHSSATPLSLAPGTYGFAFLKVAPNAKVVLHGPASVVFGNLTLQALSEVEFDTTLGPIELYVTGSLRLADTSVVSMTSEDPSQVTVQLPNVTTNTLHSTGEFYGSIYGPQATLEVGTRMEFFGSLVAAQLSFQPGVQIHFDQHLAVLGAQSTLPTLYSWHIMSFAPLGPEPDPFKVLGVVKSALRLPSDAHEDQLLDVTYYDNSGVLKRYSGMESNFDWTQVSDVLDLERDNQTTALTVTKTHNLLNN